jgi:hypothetical protein
MGVGEVKEGVRWQREVVVVVVVVLAVAMRVASVADSSGGILPR